MYQGQDGAAPLPGAGLFVRGAAAPPPTQRPFYESILRAGGVIFYTTTVSRLAARVTPV